jgi:hypothetical protein
VYTAGNICTGSNATFVFATVGYAGTTSITIVTGHNPNVESLREGQFGLVQSHELRHNLYDK